VRNEALDGGASFAKGRNYPSLAKRGGGRFSNDGIDPNLPFSIKAKRGGGKLNVGIS